MHGGFIFRGAVQAISTEVVQIQAREEILETRIDVIHLGMRTEPDVVQRFIVRDAVSILIILPVFPEQQPGFAAVFRVFRTEAGEGMR